MHFLGSKFTQNALAAGAPPRTPLGELQRYSAPPDPLPISGGRFAAGERERREKREKGKGREGVFGKGKREEGKGREEGKEGKGKEEGRGVCVIGVSSSLMQTSVTYTRSSLSIGI